MVIINGAGEITSYPAWAIIEPNWKYLESNFLYPLTNFFIGNTLEDTGKWIEAKNLHKKKTPDNEVFYGFTKSMFPCFHCFSKTTPAHILKLCH